MTPTNKQKGQGHTPGPWEVEEPEEGFTSVRVILEFGNSFDYNPRLGYEDEQQALIDAQLIAAAPELLEALKDAKCLLFESGLYAKHQATYGVIEEAIAHAEGRT